MRRLISTLLVALMALSGFSLAEKATADLQEDVPAVESIQPSEEAAESPSAPVPQTARPTDTPAPQDVRLAFEDGFSLCLPEGWKFYPTDAQMAQRGVLYCLSDASCSGWLYVQRWDTDCVDMNEVQALIGRATESFSSSIHSFNGCDFVVYDLSEGDVSCCATLLDGALLNLVFTPQSDADFMAVAARILNSFERT